MENRSFLQNRSLLLIEEAENKKQMGFHHEAIQICEAILTHDLDCQEAYEEIGDNYLSLREYGKSKKALEHVLRLNPYNANANYLLGFVYSCMGKWKTSIDYLERADEIYSNHPEILRCLGWSMYHDGQRKRGIIILDRAAHLKPEDSLILSDLGVIYMNEKEFDKAGQLFKKVLTLEPENQKAKECLNAVRFFEREYDKLKKSSQN